MELKVEYLTPEELRPYARNAKEHPEEQVKEIMASIEEFGFSDPIGIWGDNEIVEGHGRLMAALQLGLKKVPVIRLDHLTDEQRRAYALAHNQTTMTSGWDEDKLLAELKDITTIDMAEFGFELEDDASIFEDQEEQQEEEQIPASRLTFFSVSVFGMDSECFLDVQIPEEDAERITKAARENGQAIGEKLLEVLRGL